MSTHTIATLAISPAAFDEIAGKLRAAGYHHVFGANGVIDMTGIGLAATWKPVGAPKCTCLSRSGPDYCKVHAA